MESSAHYVLEALDVRRVFGTGEAKVEALRGVTVHVSEGELLAIMGKSGSGKSTLLHILGGVDTPSEGKVLFNHRDLATLSDDDRTIIRRREIGFIFQSFNLLPTLTAEENVSLPLLLDNVDAKTAQERAMEALHQVRMEKRSTHIPSEMSGGEQQRVAIARALVINPKILLADEPTGNLDSANGELVMDLLRSLVDTHRQTIVMITHDHEIARQADRVIHIGDGLIRSEEEPRQEVGEVLVRERKR
ncbi:MAG: ABC transporter ATP-binding protein [Pirellulales bacterium]